MTEPKCPVLLAMYPDHVPCQNYIDFDIRNRELEAANRRLTIRLNEALEQLKRLPEYAEACKGELAAAQQEIDRLGIRAYEAEVVRDQAIAEVMRLRELLPFKDAAQRLGDRVQTPAAAAAEAIALSIDGHEDLRGMMDQVTAMFGICLADGRRDRSSSPAWDTVFGAAYASYCKLHRIIRDTQNGAELTGSLKKIREELLDSAAYNFRGACLAQRMLTPERNNDHE